MKRPNVTAAIGALTGRRIDGATATRVAVKNALSKLRGWCDGLRREIDGRNGRKNVPRDSVEDIRGLLAESRMHMDEEELRNLNNENLENELRELERKMGL